MTGSKRKTAIHVAAALGLLATAPAALAQQAQTIETERHDIDMSIVAQGLANPWGLAFIGDSKFLVTERPGDLRIVSANGDISEPLKGVPDVVAQNQGGLLDVATDPDFAENNRIYLSFSEADPDGGDGNSTAVVSATLGDDEITDVKVIFRGAPKYESSGHFGSRLVFSKEGHLFITLGDRQTAMDDAQTLDNHHGKVVRIWPDGSTPDDNPFVNDDNALENIWSYGHRNVQGAALHPDTGELWTVEHGPRGGDEVNITRKGKNYGWPDATYGIDYNGDIISEKTHVEGTEQPHYYWLPSIATSGMMIYNGDKFPQWKGDVFIGALRGQHVARLDLEGDRVMHEEKLLKDDIKQRVRAIAEGPDGYIYILTDDPDGRLVRLQPAAE